MLKWMAEKWVRSRLMSANHQEEIDTHLVALLLSLKEKLADVHNEEELEAMLPTSLNLSYAKQRALISQTLDREFKRLFEIVHAKGGVDPYPAPVIERHPEEEHLTYEEVAERRLDVLTESEARKQEAEILQRPLPHPDGFTLQIQYSSIDHPAAGFGLCVKEGRVLPGSVIGLYPGMIYTAETFPLLNKVRRWGIESPLVLILVTSVL
jgi:hypothetical protein